MSTQSSSRAEFYVGYSPATPRKLSLFRRRVVSSLAAMALLVAVSIVLAQQPFIPSLFEFLQYRTFQGVVEEHPYPTLLVPRPGLAAGDLSFSRYMLTVPGKLGAGAETSGLAGKQVRLEGALIYLGGDTMIELNEGTLEVASTAPPADPLPRTSLGEVTVEGEIVDTKCYLGVMNPAKGKVHKACAIRCISGGVPPSVLVRDESGRGSILILVGRDGRPLHKEVLEFVGEPVRVRGELMRSGDSRYLSTEPADFVRLGK